MNVPDDRRYTDQHEWVMADEDGTLRVGITDYAQDALGDVVFVAIVASGTAVASGDSIAEVESTKSVAEVYAPVAGEILEVNHALAGDPALVNTSPYGDGWFAVITPSDMAAFDGLLDAAGYRALIG